MTIKTIEDLRQLPEPLLRYVLEYAEQLAARQDPAQQQERVKWPTVVPIKIKGEPLSQTVIRMREEERW